MGKAYKVVEGRRPIGLQMAQSTWVGFWAHVFVDCMDCNQSFGVVLDHDKDEISDKKFIAEAEARGWEVVPGKRILCPGCKEWRLTEYE